MKALSHRALNPAPLTAREIPLIVILFPLDLKNLFPIIVMAKMRVYLNTNNVSRKHKRKVYMCPVSKLQVNEPQQHHERERHYKWNK